MNIAFTSIGSALGAKLDYFALKHWVWSCYTRGSLTKQGRWSWHLKNWAVVSQVRPIDVNLNPVEKSKLMSQKCTGAVCLPSRPETFVGLWERITSGNSTWNLILSIFKGCDVLREDTCYQAWKKKMCCKYCCALSSSLPSSHLSRMPKECLKRMKLQGTALHSLTQ